MGNDGQYERRYTVKSVFQSIRPPNLGENARRRPTDIVFFTRADLVR